MASVREGKRSGQSLLPSIALALTFEFEALVRSATRCHEAPTKNSIVREVNGGVAGSENHEWREEQRDAGTQANTEACKNEGCASN